MTEPRLRVGAAQTDLTPSLGTELAGLFETRPASDVESPLLAKAIAVQAGGAPVVLITCDLIYLPATLTDLAKSIIAERAGVPVDRVVISCTHTHTGPATIRTGTGAAVDPHFLDELPGRIAESAILACARLRPATIAVGTTTVDGICFNRRYLTDDGYAITHWGDRPGEPRPAGPTDPAVTALLAEDTDGRPIALWAHLSLHYVGIDDQTMISSDYYGRFAEAVRAQLGDDVIAVLCNGASGDINNVDPRRRVPITGTRRARLVGRAVAGAALAATALAERSGAITVDARSLPFRAHRYPVTDDDRELAAKIIAEPSTEAWFSYAPGNPVPPPVAERFARNLLELDTLPAERPTAIGLITIGDLGLVALPGEVFVEHGLRLKEHSPHRVTAIVGLADDHLGYLPTRRAFAQGGYETWRSPTSWTRPGTGEDLVETVLRAWEDA